MTNRPIDKDHTHSYILVWKKDIPTIEESHWQPGYTPAHCASVDDAIKYAAKVLTEELADLRQKWVNINTMMAAIIESDTE